MQPTANLFAPGPDQQPKAVKKPSFNLKIGNLGLSTLKQEDGKTQEELDVEQLVKKPQSNFHPVDQ